MLMVSAELPEDERRQIMNAYRPALVFAPRPQRGDYTHMRELRAIDNYILFSTNYSEPWPVNPALGQLITTSGSTGSVKYVRHSWDNIRVNARIFVEIMGMTAEERTITTLPMHYTGGLSIICASLMAGATMVVTRRGVMDEEFWDLFENERVTAFHGVSRTFDMLRRLDMFCEDFPDLRVMSQGGSRLDKDLHRYVAQYAGDYGKRFVVVYGQSEATAAISCLPAERALDKPGSVGVAVPGGSIELIDAEGKPVVEPHIPGELVYRGANVALGYATRGEDLARGDDWRGVLRTGDVAERDGDGFLYITGRLKRFIKMSGHRISLDEIDEKIMDEIHIRCVSSGVDDHLVIFVLSDGDADAVRDFIRRRLSVVRTGCKVVTIDAFPANQAGKVLYGELLEMAKRA